MAEYFDEVVLDAEDLEKLFQAATEFVRTARNLSDDKKLTFYALYKQVCTLFLNKFPSFICTNLENLPEYCTRSSVNKIRYSYSENMRESMESNMGNKIVLLNQC